MRGGNKPDSPSLADLKGSEAAAYEGKRPKRIVDSNVEGAQGGSRQPKKVSVGGDKKMSPASDKKKSHLLMIDSKPGEVYCCAIVASNGTPMVQILRWNQ